MATLHFPDRAQKMEMPANARVALPDGEWTVLPSHSTFLVPLTFPARVMRRLGDAQLRDLVFDRIPLPESASKVWMLIPRLGFFSAGPATAWAVVSPLSALPAGFDRCLPEDLLLTALVWDRRFRKGGIVALDSPSGVTLIGISRKAKSVAVWKQMAAMSGPSINTAADIPPSLAALIGRETFLLRLNAGGSMESLLSKYGNVVTEDASDALSGSLPAILSQKRATLYPNILASSSTGQDRSKSAQPPGKENSPAGGRWIRSGLLSLALLLPLISLWTMKARSNRQADSMVRAMQSGYEKRFGVKIPESLASNPVLALRDKSRYVSAATAPTAVPLHTWLYIMDRLSGQAFASGLKLDAVSLDEVRVEVRGTSADLQSVAKWVANLSSDPVLADAVLVSSETRMSDRRTAFKVRARVRIVSGESKS